jgi:copper chaperone CopZ
MKKTFLLSALDCAACADRMETAIRRIPGVTGAQVNFVTQKLTLEADDTVFSQALEETRKIAARTVRGCLLQ